MSCRDLDLKAYTLGEASAAERKAVESHAASCAACGAELESLGALRVAMMTWADEEPPRRIAFVSDKVFEPRWWQRPLAGMNLAGMLGTAALAAIATFAVVRTQTPVTVQAPAAVNAAEIEKRVADAVKNALAENDAAQQARTAELIRATERRLRLDNERTAAQLAIVESSFDYLRKRDAARYMRASAGYGDQQ